jgi:RimJ/RimL family protein N-acetyltransferase
MRAKLALNFQNITLSSHPLRWLFYWLKHMIDYTQKQEYIEFLRAGLGFNKADYAVITQVNNGEIEAVVGFNNCSQHNIEISIVAIKPVTRALIKACAVYAFGQCGVERITNIAEIDNVKSQEFSQRLGFVKEFEPLKRWFGNKDGVQFVMFKENCKWIRGLK